MIVAIDVGNTAVKFGAFDGPPGAERLVASERVQGGRDVASRLLPFPFVSTADELVVCSSAPSQLELLLANLGRDAHVLGDAERSRVPTSYARPEELGLDRLAGALGAQSIAGGGAVVLVDAGTAITVDALDGDGRFVAIAIAAGLPAMEAGMRAAAPHLPRPAVGEGAVELPARGTADSLRTGFLLGAAGLTDRLVEEARAIVGLDAPVVVTGGSAGALRGHLRTESRLAPDVVLHGTVALHRAPDRAAQA